MTNSSVSLYRDGKATFMTAINLVILFCFSIEFLYLAVFIAVSCRLHKTTDKLPRTRFLERLS